MLKRVLIWTGVVLVLIGIAHALWTNSLRRKFEARLEEIRARGEPVEFAELEPPKPPDERNAAPLYEKAKAWLDENYDSEYTDVLLRPRDSWSDEDWAVVRAWVDSRAPLIEIIHEAAARPDCWFELDWSRPLDMGLPLLNVSMRTREALELRAILDGGSKHVEALLKMARHRNQPTIISHLVRVTLQRAAAETLKEIVADPELDARVLRARLDPVFREAEDAASVHNALLGERAVAIHAVYLSMAGELEEYGHSYPFSMWPFRSLAYLDAIGVLDTWDEAIELSGKPYAEARAGYESLRVRTEARKFPYILTKMYGALPGRFYEQTVKHTARMRLARIALWLLERKQRTGSWPDALESSLPPDPFTNRPFYYRPRGAGVRLAADIPLNSEDYEELVWELD